MQECQTKCSPKQYSSAKQKKCFILIVSSALLCVAAGIEPALTHDALVSSLTSLGEKTLGDIRSVLTRSLGFGSDSNPLGRALGIMQGNCLQLVGPLKPSAESLMPNFLFFNEKFAEDPFIVRASNITRDTCKLANFDAQRKTVVLIHGFLSGYLIVDELVVVKDRYVDADRVRVARELAGKSSSAAKNDWRGLREDVRKSLHNIIYVDWNEAANPAVSRANYLWSVLNAPNVGAHIAELLESLVRECGASSERISVISHSLGTHVAGFVGKQMNKRRMQLARIVWLEPVGICFGRGLGRKAIANEFRLRPSDARHTQAVHTARDAFANVLDAAHTNIMVNDGMKQPGCSDSDVANSTKSSIQLLIDTASPFNPCGHIRSIELLDDDGLSSGVDVDGPTCQMVAYRCFSHANFIAGKCGFCDAQNRQCTLLGAPGWAPTEPVVGNKTQVPSGGGDSDKWLASDEIAPMFYVSTTSVHPYCVHYYQLRVLVHKTQVQKFLRDAGGESASVRRLARAGQTRPRLRLHLGYLHIGVRLDTADGRLFKRFTLQDNARTLQLARVSAATIDAPTPAARFVQHHDYDDMYELTLLLNSTLARPQRVTRARLTFDFHRVLESNVIEINYMSHISPSVRQTHSSVLCPRKLAELDRVIEYELCDESKAVKSNEHAAPTTSAPVPAAATTTKVPNSQNKQQHHAEQQLPVHEAQFSVWQMF